MAVLAGVAWRVGAGRVDAGGAALDGETQPPSGSEWSSKMRMRGLEPPPSYLDTDLNRARLPIPPHPQASVRQYRTGRRSGRAVPGFGAGPRLLASKVAYEPPSSRGLGRRPLTAVTRVRIPLAVLTGASCRPDPLARWPWSEEGRRAPDRVWCRGCVLRCLAVVSRVVEKNPAVAATEATRGQIFQRGELSRER